MHLCFKKLQKRDNLSLKKKLQENIYSYSITIIILRLSNFKQYKKINIVG